ncbi:MAG: hypothetical protein DYG98_23465 [Haliscomenobacteraceae bacterium CHB4]|nr:hypothetical protein [Saprospiraceae bacterium]MCE7926019.1 hypothetical protein [Haliscomenobacteraceae bacterium CHB4]
MKETTWISPANFITSSSSLSILYPEPGKNYLSVKRKLFSANTHWISMDIHLPPGAIIQDIIIGYQVSHSSSSIRQIKLMAAGIPGNETTLFEDNKVLKNTIPSTYAVTTGGINLPGDKVIMLSLKCDLPSSSHQIKISSIGIRYTDPSTAQVSHLVDIAALYPDIYAAVADVSGDNVSWLIRSGHHIDTADLVIPRQVTLHFEGQGELIVLNNWKLTIEGGIVAGLNRIFHTFDDVSGAVTGDVKLLTIPKVFPQWWGAVPIPEFTLGYSGQGPGDLYMVVSDQQNDGTIWYQGIVPQGGGTIPFKVDPFAALSPAPFVWITVYSERGGTQLQQFSFDAAAFDSFKGTTFPAGNPITKVTDIQLTYADNWSPAIQAAVRSRTTDDANERYKNSGTWCYIPPGNYYCHDSIHLDTSGRISGAGGYFSSILKFRGNIDGLIVHGIGTSPLDDPFMHGGGSMIENLLLTLELRNNGEAFLGPKETFLPTKINWDKGNGVLAKARCSLRNLWILGFGGDGIRFDGTAGLNVNTWSVISCRLEQCVGHGLHIFGRDAHAGVSINCEARHCGGSGLAENSGFGNLHIGFTSNICGGACFLQVKESDGNYLYAPNDGAPNYSTYLGCYVEGHPPSHPPYFTGNPLVVGGNLSYWANGTSARTVSYHGLFSRLGFGNRYPHRGESWTVPGDGANFLRMFHSQDGARAAEVAIEVTAGPDGAVIPPYGVFSTEEKENEWVPLRTPARIGFVPDQEYVIPPGVPTPINVQCNQVGTIGNVEAGAIKNPDVDKYSDPPVNCPFVKIENRVRAAEGDALHPAKVELYITTAGPGDITVRKNDIFYTDLWPDTYHPQERVQRIDFYYPNLSPETLAPNEVRTLTVRCLQARAFDPKEDMAIVGAGKINHTEIPGIVKVHNDNMPTKGVNGTFSSNLFFKERKPTRDVDDPQDFLAGKVCLEYTDNGNIRTTPFFWTGGNDYYYQPGQFGFGNSIADSSFWATQFLDDDVPGENNGVPGEHIFEFTGSPHYDANVFHESGNVLPQESFLCIPDIRCSSPNVEIAAKWFEIEIVNEGTINEYKVGKYKVKVYNHNPNVVHVRIGMLFLRRSKRI